MKRRWLILIVVLVVALLLLPSVTVRRDQNWIDSVSASRKRQSVWIFGVASTPVVSESPLADRFRKLGLHWQPDWMCVRNTAMNAYGISRSGGHGPAPEVYTFAFHDDLQLSYLDASTEDEIREFFKIMSTGTHEEKQAAVDKAFEKALSE